ncbi:MAG: DNA polymerase subunit beta [Desulfurococcaceae archaeon]
MSRVKVRRVPEFKEVVYGEEHWRLLRYLRGKALELMKPLVEKGLAPWLHGSVARGDVWIKSDIDIVIPRGVQGYIVDTILEDLGIKPYAKYLVAATPTTSLKAIIAIDEEERFTISFSMFDFKPRDLEFYKYSGLLSYEDLVIDKRVPGVNKNLVLIIPTQTGHLEAPVVGYEEYIASILGVSIEIVKERVEVLTKRDSVGRTGIFAKLVLAPDESFEEALIRLFKEKPLLRRIYSDLI